MILKARMAARQVKGDHPDIKGYPGPQGWGLGVRLKIPPQKKGLVKKNTNMSHLGVMC